MRVTLQKLTIHVLIIVFLPLIGGFVFHIIEQHDQLAPSRLGYLRTLANTQETAIENIEKTNLELLALVTSQTQLRLRLDEFNRTGSPESLEKIGNIIADANDSIEDFETISILNNEGTVLVSTDEAMQEVDLSNTTSFRQSQQGPSMHVEQTTGGDLQLILAAPLLLDDTKIGNIRIAANLESFQELARTHNILGQTGEILLAQRTPDGDVLYITPPRFPETSFQQRVPLGNAPTPITEALNKNETLLEGVTDYRGKDVLAVTRYITGAQWGLVVKMDRDELFQSIFAIQAIDVGILIAVLILITIAVNEYARNIEVTKSKKKR